MKEKKKHNNDFITILGYLIIVGLTIIAGVFTLTLVDQERISCQEQVKALELQSSNDCLLVTNYIEYIQQDTCEFRPVIVEVIR